MELHTHRMTMLLEPQSKTDYTQLNASSAAHQIQNKREHQALKDTNSEQLQLTQEHDTQSCTPKTTHAYINTRSD